MPNRRIRGAAIGFVSVCGVTHSSVVMQSRSFEKTSAVVVMRKASYMAISYL
jgi:hypothetical protein